LPELRLSTTVIVKIGPIVNSTGITPVTNLTVSGADEAELLIVGTTATLGLAGTLAAITNADGYYNLTLSATELKACGPVCVVINDDDACLPFKQWFEVVDSKYYDSKYGTTLWNVNVESVSGDTAAADTLETHIEGTTLFKVDVDAVRTATATAANIATSHTNINSIASLLVTVSSQTTAINSNAAAILTQVGDIHTDIETMQGNVSSIASLLVTVSSQTAIINSNAAAALTQIGDVHTNIGTIQGNVNSIAALLVSVSSVTTIINSNTAQTAGRILAEYGATEKLAIDLLDDVDGGLSDIHTIVNGITTDVGALPSASDNATAVAGSIVEGTMTYTQALRVMMAALVGKLSGGGTVTLTFRDTTDATNRIVATVDANGNRSAVTLTVT
jgi:archaellum component FlaC